MITTDGIDIKKAKLLFDGNIVGTFTSLEVNAEKPREVMTTIGGEMKHRSGTDRFTWTGQGLVPVNGVQTTLTLMKKTGSFVIEGETADDTGATETLTLTGCQITGYQLNMSDNSTFNITGICDEPR